MMDPSTVATEFRIMQAGVFFYDVLWKRNVDLAEWSGSDAFELWYWQISLRI